MNSLKKILVTALLILQSSCVFDTYQSIQYAEEEKTRIEIYYPNLPSCDYKIVGYIEANGFYFSKQSLFQGLAEEAAKIDADGVIIEFIKQLGIKEYVASGKAIRCLK